MYSLILSTCATGGMLIRRNRDSMFNIIRPFKHDIVLPFSHETFTEFTPSFQPDMNRDSISIHNNLKFAEDKTNFIISERHITRPSGGLSFEGRDTNRAVLDESMRSMDQLRLLPDGGDDYDKDDVSKDINPLRLLTKKTIYTRIYNQPEDYPTILSRVSPQILVKYTTTPRILLNSFVRMCSFRMEACL